MLAQTHYKNWKQYKVAIGIHWQLCKAFYLEHGEKWCTHKAERILENVIVKVMWDMKLLTDKEIKFSKPDIVVIAQDKKSCLLIDVACPSDMRLIERE